MSIGEYLLYSLMGVCVVFFALILLLAIIKIMTALRLSDEPKKAKDDGAAASAAPAAAVEAELAPGSAGDLKLYDTDPRDAAMIMAIVADELQKPINELRFISIREIAPAEE